MNIVLWLGLGDFWNLIAFSLELGFGLRGKGTYEDEDSPSILLPFYSYVMYSLISDMLTLSTQATYFCTMCIENWAKVDFISKYRYICVWSFSGLSLWQNDNMLIESQLIVCLPRKFKFRVYSEKVRVYVFDVEFKFRV